jgi:UPF0755 protein
MKTAPGAITAVLIILALGLGAHTVSFLKTEVKPRRTVFMEIEPGTSAWGISCTLEKVGVIKDAPTFMALALLTGKARRLQAGIYVFEGSHAPLDIMDTLFMGRTLKYRLTIPEGYTIHQVAQAVGQTGIVRREDFLACAMDPQSASSLGIEAPTLEGFLFPDTYFLVPRSTPLEIASKMINRFRKAFTEEMEARARHLGMNRLDVVTLASIIEKEAMNQAEKPLISSVFHNRLKRGMRLQSDPTAIYGLEGFTGRIRHEDLLRDSPYNTYLHKGLPPGPICNPGMESIRAALWPADTGYLYFFARGDGTHVFSTTIEDHNRAISSRIRSPEGGRFF